MGTIMSCGYNFNIHETDESREIRECAEKKIYLKPTNAKKDKDEKNPTDKKFIGIEDVPFK